MSAFGTQMLLLINLRDVCTYRLLLPALTTKNIRPFPLKPKEVSPSRIKGRMYLPSSLSSMHFSMGPSELSRFHLVTMFQRNGNQQELEDVAELCSILIFVIP